jgi:hypothetical protein
MLGSRHQLHHHRHGLQERRLHKPLDLAAKAATSRQRLIICTAIMVHGLSVAAQLLPGKKPAPASPSQPPSQRAAPPRRAARGVELDGRAVAPGKAGADIADAVHAADGLQHRRAGARLRGLLHGGGDLRLGGALRRLLLQRQVGLRDDGVPGGDGGPCDGLLRGGPRPAGEGRRGGTSAGSARPRRAPSPRRHRRLMTGWLEGRGARRCAAPHRQPWASA